MIPIAILVFLAPYFSMVVFGPPPEERIEISLPFGPEDEAIGISPAGELLYHDGDLGHCGLDFGFNKSARLIASADGRIAELSRNKKGSWDIGIVSGGYVIRYGLLDDYNKELTKGSIVKKGDFIGIPQGKTDGQNFAFHFEFASALSMKYPWMERLCPYTYFDPESKTRIDLIWKNDKWPYREIYPGICSGGYKGRDSIAEALRLDLSGYAANFNMTRDRILAEEIDARLAAGTESGNSSEKDASLGKGS